MKTVKWQVTTHPIRGKVLVITVPSYYREGTWELRYIVEGHPPARIMHLVQQVSVHLDHLKNILKPAVTV